MNGVNVCFFFLHARLHVADLKPYVRSANRRQPKSPASTHLTQITWIQLPTMFCTMSHLYGSGVLKQRNTENLQATVQYALQLGAFACLKMILLQMTSFFLLPSGRRWSARNGTFSRGHFDFLRHLKETCHQTCHYSNPPHVSTTLQMSQPFWYMVTIHQLFKAPSGSSSAAQPSLVTNAVWKLVFCKPFPWWGFFRG